MDANAFYVQTQARTNLALFLTSGYQAASTNRAQSQLDTPAITGIDNDISTQLNVHLTPITNAVGYEVQTCIGMAPWVSALFSTQARTIMLTSLTTGTVVQVRAGPWATAPARATGQCPAPASWTDLAVSQHASHPAFGHPLVQWVRDGVRQSRNGKPFRFFLLKRALCAEPQPQREVNAAAGLEYSRAPPEDLGDEAPPPYKSIKQEWKKHGIACQKIVADCCGYSGGMGDAGRVC